VTVCVALAREVMNKDWLFWLVFLAFLTVGLIGMWVCRRRPTMVVLILLLVALAGGTQMMTLNHVYADEKSAPERVSGMSFCPTSQLLAASF